MTDGISDEMLLAAGCTLNRWSAFDVDGNVVAERNWLNTMWVWKAWGWKPRFRVKARTA